MRAARLGVLFAAVLAHAVPAAAEPDSAAGSASDLRSDSASDHGSDSASSWLDRMIAAQRLGTTLAAKIRAHTVDHTQSERDVVIELLRDARGPTMRSVVEVREADPESTTRPVVFRIDSLADGTLVSWLWDIRWQRFVKMSGLDGTENFDGTHFHLEDLGFSSLAPRRSGEVRDVAGAPGQLEIASGAYHHYGRVETRIDRATALPVRTHIYDGTDARIWEIDFAEVETIGGRPLPTRMTATNPVTDERSTLEWVQVAVGLRIPDEVFDLEYLDAVIRRGDDPIALPEPGVVASEP